MAKRCVKCGDRKPEGNFFRHPTNKDGLQAYCRDCQNESRKQYAYKRGPQKSTEATRKSRAKWKKKNKEKSRLSSRVTRMVWGALKSGEIHKLPCEVCGESKVEGHHDDYTKPLDVRWLCRKHHLQHHKTRSIRLTTHN